MTHQADRQEGGELDDGFDRHRQHQPVLVFGGVGMAGAEQHGEQGQQHGDDQRDVAMLLALFGAVRHPPCRRHRTQDGLVLAVAVETVVKLAAFLAIGLMVTFLMFGGPGDMFGELAQNDRCSRQ